MKILGKISLLLRQMLTTVYFRIVKMDGTPKQVAAGFALGTFIGIFPTFGLGGVIAVAMSFILRLNVAATLLGNALIMNPITTPTFWSLSFLLGSILYPEKRQIGINEIKNGMLFKGILDITTVYLAGNVLIALVVSIISYFVVKHIVDSYRKMKIKKNTV